MIDSSSTKTIMTSGADLAATSGILIYTYSDLHVVGRKRHLGIENGIWGIEVQTDVWIHLAVVWKNSAYSPMEVYVNLNRFTADQGSFSTSGEPSNPTLLIGRPSVYDFEEQYGINICLIQF